MDHRVAEKRLLLAVALVVAAMAALYSALPQIAVETGARSTAHWLAAETRDGIGQIRVRDKLARIAVDDINRMKG